MIERVAWALWLREALADFGEPVHSDAFDNLRAAHQDGYRDAARTAVEAMREPDDAMIAALADAPTMLDAWPAMITAALAEEAPAPQL